MSTFFRYVLLGFTTADNVHIQGVPLILVETLRGGRGHEDKHY